MRTRYQTSQEVHAALPAAGVALVLSEARQCLLLEGGIDYGRDRALYGPLTGLDDVDAAVGALRDEERCELRERILRLISSRRLS